MSPMAWRLVSVLCVVIAVTNVSLAFAWRRIYELTRWKDEERERVHSD